MSEPMLRLRLPLLACLFCATAVAQAPDPLPEPQLEGSGEAYQRAAKDVTAKALGRLLARYDERLMQYPAEMPTALERCRFLQGVSYDTDGEPREPYASLHSKCLEEMAAHADDVRAVTYAVENSYGEERIQIAREALLGAALAWSASDRGKLRLTLAHALEAAGDTKAALEEAQIALQDDRTADVSLLFARAAKDKGKASEAKAWLTRGLDDTPVGQELVEKARLLHELSAHKEAQHAMQLAETSKGVQVDALLKARILSACGRVDAARSEYKKLTATFQRATALNDSFELELKHGDAKQASAAYEAMRDEDFFRDPLLHHRFRLLWAHPSVAWHLRDALGGLAFLALVLAIFALPCLGLLPVHYVGLVLRQRRGDMSYYPSNWNLRRAAVLLGAYFAVQVLAAVIFSYGVVHEWLTEESVPDLSDAELAAYGFAFSIGGLLVVATVVSVPEILRCLSCEESTLATAMRVAKGFGAALLVAAVNGLVVRALSLESFANGALVADVTTREVLLAVQRNHGLGGLVFVAAFCAPLVEELIFRYALTDALELHLSRGWANGLQALAFALCHDQWTFWPSLFFMGWLAGSMRRKSDSLIGAVGLHSMWNLTASLMIAAGAARHL